MFFSFSGYSCRVLFSYSGYSCRVVPYFECSHFKLEGGTRSTCHSSLESTPCSEFPGGSPQSLNTELLSMTSSALASSVDQLSTGSPDQESNPSVEVNGIVPEDNGPETFSILEVPESAPGPVAEENGTGEEACDHIQDVDLVNGVSGLHFPPGEDGGDDIIPGLKEEPDPAADPAAAAVHAQLCLQEQDSSAEAQEGHTIVSSDPQSTFSEASPLDSLTVPSSLSWPPGAEQWLPGIGVCEVSTEEASPEPDILTHVEVPSHLSSNPWHVVTDHDTGQKETPTSECGTGNMGAQETTPLVSALVADTREHWLDQPLQDEAVTSSDEEDIYAHGLPSSPSETSVAELEAGRSLQDLSQPGTDDTTLLKADQVCVLMEETELRCSCCFSFKGHPWLICFPSYGKPTPAKSAALKSGFGTMSYEGS